MNLDDPTPQERFDAAEQLRAQDSYQEAATAYEAYLEVAVLAWQEYDAQIGLALCLNELDRREDAYDHAIQALGDDPSRAEALMTAGLHHFLKGHYERAAPLFLAATHATRPAQGMVYDANYTYLPFDYLGVCYHQLGRQAEAIAVTVKAIELGSPDQARLKDNLGYMTQQL